MRTQALRTDRAAGEDVRAALQERITFLFKIMFWSLVALTAFLAALYEAAPVSAPEHRHAVYVLSAVGLAAMAVIWRGLLVRRPLSIRALHALDLVYALGIGASFGASALLQHDLRAAGYLSVVYTSFTVFARALIVPSSGRRTAITSGVTFVPMTISAIGLAVLVDQDAPPATYIFAYLLFCGVAIVLSAYGSGILYGLRRRAASARQLGQYTLDRKIGEGGMGVVYLAHHLLLRRPTAIKLVRVDSAAPERYDRFEREVQHMSQLTHPNTVAVYDYGRSPDGAFYYAMEYLGRGIDLEALVHTYGPQPSARVAHILAQACGALHEAHLRGIVHRDIKPANLILCERGGIPDVVKVVDFGLVKELTADTGQSAQVILGTPDYIAPEAVTDPSSISPAVDLYALGAVGYFLLTGTRVFHGKTAIDICLQHVTAAPRAPSSISATYVAPALEALILRCLEKQPAARPATALALRGALLDIARSEGDWSELDARRWWREHVSEPRSGPSGAHPVQAAGGRNVSAAQAPVVTGQDR